jgi:hypothetical protein
MDLTTCVLRSAAGITAFAGGVPSGNPAVINWNAAFTPTIYMGLEYGGAQTVIIRRFLIQQLQLQA